MEKIEIIKSVVNTIRENKGLEHLGAINNSTHLRNDLNLDSLDLAELTVRLEKETGIDVFADEVVQTVGELVEKIS